MDETGGGEKNEKILADGRSKTKQKCQKVRWTDEPPGADSSPIMV